MMLWYSFFFGMQIRPSCILVIAYDMPSCILVVAYDKPLYILVVAYATYL